MNSHMKAKRKTTNVSLRISIKKLSEQHRLIPKMLSVFIQVLVLTSLLTVETLALDVNIENNTYTNIQTSNIYCHSSRVNNAQKVICDFRHTAAKLGNPEGFLKGKIEQQGKDLHLEIHNCSILVISAVFHSWRHLFSSLRLTIENVDDVVQEEMPLNLGYIQNSLPSGDFISFTLKNSKMDYIKPYLISDTKALLIEIQESHIGTIFENAFLNVYKLWQLRIIKSNISRIANRAMPDVLSIEPSQTAPVHEMLTPFIFNETRIEMLDSNSIQLRIMEKDEYFNIVNSQFVTIAKGGILITGLGHVLIADSQFHQIENDSIIIHLRGMETESSHKLIAYSTLTLMGIDIFSMDINNFLRNIQITNGKLYLIRLNFRYPGALPSIITMDNSTISHISDHNQTTAAERWTVICSCREVANSLHVSPNNNDRKEPQELDNGVLSVKQSDYDYEEPTETSPTPAVTNVSSIYSDILKELRCYQDKEGSSSITTNEFDASFCPDVTTEAAVEGKNHNTTYGIPESEQSSNSSYYNQSMVWYLSATGGCIIIAIAILSFLAIFRHKRKSFKIHNKQKTNKAYRPNNSNVISEDPICGCEEGEEESQL